MLVVHWKKKQALQSENLFSVFINQVFTHLKLIFFFLKKTMFIYVDKINREKK